MKVCVCGIHGLTYIETFKLEVAWATDKQLQVFCNVMLL